MNIVYKDTLRKVLSIQQAQNERIYYKCYYLNNVLEKEEKIYKGKAVGLCYYNNNRAIHSTLLNTYSGNYNKIVIVDIEASGDIILHTLFEYNEDVDLVGKLIKLFDSNNDLIAEESQDENGITEFEHCQKFFWNRNASQIRPLFETEYDSVTGAFKYFAFDMLHAAPFGQSKFTLLNNPSDIQKLTAITGLNKDWIDYYLTPYARPTFF